MSQLPVPGVRNVMAGLIGPYEKRGERRGTKLRLLSVAMASALSVAAGAALLLAGVTRPAHSRPLVEDTFAADVTPPLLLASFTPPAEIGAEVNHASLWPGLNPASDVVVAGTGGHGIQPSPEARVEERSFLQAIGFNEWINLAAVLAVVWIALRTERLRRQADDTGRFRRLHERLDDHSRRLAAHETRLQGLPTHKDLARIDARLIAVEQTMQQVAHSVMRMEDFLINGVAANAAVMELSNDT